ncbi:MAG TPA: ATP-binding protein [Catalimonadaceae bacterium]|nr:ATP-binding protein [Catalimonadaceae bacterium]
MVGILSLSAKTVLQPEKNQSTDMLLSIMESSEDQIFAIDNDGRYLIFNDSHKREMVNCYGQEIYLGMEPEQIICKTIVHTDFREACQNARNGKRATMISEFGDPLFRKIWVQVTFNPLFDQSKQIFGVSVFARDISKTKANEDQLLAAKEAAQADARAKSAFLSSMSHEIRTPMNAILGLTELLLNKRMDENSTENLKAIRFSANNLLTIINDILDFSKIEAGKFSFDIHTFDFFQVLDELNKSIKISAQSRNLVYEIQISGTIPNLLRGDSVRLSQILLNLLGNSLKFTQTGKIKLVVEVVKESETDILLEFKVSDTGIGIPREHLQNIFHSFTQVQSNRRFKAQGTGLGLSITKRLVEMQEGEIHVESEVGRGSVFSFRIPYLKAGAKDIQPVAEMEELGSNRFTNLKVLLVEDNKINQLLAKQILTGWGVNVEVANDGFEAIAKLQRRTFDLILLDLQMPEIDGFEVARFVRKTIKPPANQIPIVALTADAFTETKGLTQDAGMNDFITKPYQQKDLLRVLRKFSFSDHDSRDIVESIPEMESASQVIDFEFIKDKFGKDPETFRYILEVFVDDISKEMESVRIHLEKSNSADAVRLVHKLVSTFTAMGMPDSAFTLSLIERMLKQNDDKRLLMEKWETVEKEYEFARNQIKPVLMELSK